MQGLDYTSGVWQFEGYGFVPNGTSGATVAQIHGAAHDSSTIILRIYNGDMRYYSGDVIATGMYDRWFKLNLIHDVEGGTVTVYIDDEQKFQTQDRGRSQFYFKCGVYAAPRDISYYMESRWRDIKIYKKWITIKMEIMSLHQMYVQLLFELYLICKKNVVEFI